MKCPDNTTNFVESFNGKIEKLRYMPIFTFLEEIRRKFMKTIAHRFKAAKSWPSAVVLRVKLLLVKAELSSRESLVTPAGRRVFEVLDGVTSLTVDLNVHHCDYMAWDINGIASKHGASYILGERLDIESFVNPSYTIKSYLHTYVVIMHPIKDPVFWKLRDYPRLGPTK